MTAMAAALSLLLRPNAVAVSQPGRRWVETPCTDLGTALPEAFRTAERAAIDVVLSDVYCRYAVVRRPSGLRSPHELTENARLRFSASYGDLAPWALKFHFAPTGESDLVVGVSKDVLSAVTHAAEQASRKVLSVKPHLLAWAKRFSPETAKHGSHWVVSCDGDWLGVSLVRNKRCTWARSMPMRHANLQDVLDRERAMADDPTGRIPVFYGGHGLSPDSIESPGMHRRLEHLFEPGGTE